MSSIVVASLLKRKTTLPPGVLATTLVKESSPGSAVTLSIFGMLLGEKS
jgi:hypothetical protein